MAQVPDLLTMRAALALATRAPSIHNTQPWRWRIGDATIHLHANPSMMLTQSDPGGRELALSCGAALHHARVAFAALGWEARVHRLPNPADPLHMAAIEFSRHAPTENDIELAAVIPRRRTDRRHYSSWPVPPGRISHMADAAAREGICLMRIDVSDDLTSALAESARAHATDAGYQTELSFWSGMHAGNDGVPARNTPDVESGATIPARRFAHPELAQPAASEEAQGYEEIVVLSTPEDDLLAHLRAGEATSAALLTATALGLATCPITEPLEILATRETIRSRVIPDAGWPQMILRVGWPTIGADPLPATPRRELNSFLFDLDGKPLRQPAGS